jgi:TorA maturation chaperone TorD
MLSLFYLYPDEKVYAFTAEGEWIRELREALHMLDDEIFDDYLRAIEQAISGVEEGGQLTMAKEYARLFINAFPHVVAPPYASFYLEIQGLVSVEKTAEVLRFYHRAGFSLMVDLQENPDHIAHELEFMALLASEESQTSGNEKIKLEEIQMDFFSRFILPWVSIFCDKVAAGSRYPFYHNVGNLTKGFINFEKNYLGVPEELNFPKEKQSATAPS